MTFDKELKPNLKDLKWEKDVWKNNVYFRYIPMKEKKPMMISAEEILEGYSGPRRQRKVGRI